ncbi:hypothetical protein BDN67DRAFT_992388 [Paxillus ammoniavirescens]|nr:hypothetical protein BDN67DRAFT_992388 [Paxillus ammoniavirescens]
MEYQRHHAYRIQPSGEVSIHTRFVSSQPSTSSQTTDPPDVSHDLWSKLAHIDEHLEPELDTMNNKKKRTVGADFSRCACNSGEAPVYQCKDCFGVQLLCAACILSCHTSNPLHRIEVFHGLTIQLGHTLGKKCYNVQPASGDDFVVINMNGIHKIALDYCACERAQIHHKQLLHLCWFPATTILKNFHLLSLESKVSAYEYYHSFACLTDNTGLSDIRLMFMHISCKWRHLKQLKRTSRGHDPNGIEATTEGECIIKCPACPHPGINLLDGWRDIGRTNWWIYALFVAIDTNFRLKRKAVSNDVKSTCVSHNTVNMADTKMSCGLAATGVGTIDCARHNMKLPTGVADLQKGKRYSNMDYIVLLALTHFALLLFSLSYDITCHQMKMLPDCLHLDGHDKLAHIQECQMAFSFNFSFASSTKEMGPGACRDALDNHFGDWNWKKITMMGDRSMLHKITEAVQTAKIHWQEFNELEKAEEWKDDNTRANPFKSQVILLMQAATRLWLAEEEAHDLQTQVDMSLHAEEQQSHLVADEAVLGLYATDIQKAKIVTQHNALQWRLVAWARVQLLYIPAIAALRATANDESSKMAKSEDYKLWLPSELSPETACQRANTRARSALDHADRRKHASGTRYMAAHQALEALGPLLGKVGWALVLQPLNDSDMRYMGDMLDGQTKGTRNLSWIWKTYVVGLAHVAWWSKEVMLLQEKMRRVLTFLQWQVDWWLEHAEACSFETEADSALQRAMREAFQMKWSVVPVLLMHTMC